MVGAEHSHSHSQFIPPSILSFLQQLFVEASISLLEKSQFPPPIHSYCYLPFQSIGNPLAGLAAFSRPLIICKGRIFDH